MDRSRRKSGTIIVAIGLCLTAGVVANQATPAMAASSARPDFGPNVVVFNPSMPAPAIQKKIDQV